MNKKTKLKVKEPTRIIMFTLGVISLVIFLIVIWTNNKNKKQTLQVTSRVSQTENFQEKTSELKKWDIKLDENKIEENSIVGNLAIENNVVENNIDENNTTENEITENIVTDNEVTQKDSNTVTKDNTKNPKASTTPKYYIKVNIEENVVNIYEKDEDGEYTRPVKAMLCSTGTATPAAGKIYTMPNDKWNRSTWGKMVGGVYAQYYSRIDGNILFHSVPYSKQSKSALEYWEYDKLGTKASAGCIRLTVKNAKWIYDNCPPGTKVEFYESSDPGPLGKPTEQKIADESKYLRCWDPTDPDKNNPWNN